jgi:hypothetical protein
MMRRWLYCRIHQLTGASAAVPEFVGTAIAQVRTIDADSCSFFSRAPDAIELWLHTTPAAAGQVTELLRARAAEAGLPLTVESSRQRPVPHPHQTGRDVLDELAAVSTELALTFAPVIAADRRLEVAVTHLRVAAEWIEPVHRQSFLFLCWQNWAATLSPRHRGMLIETTDVTAPACLADRADRAWRRYAERTEQVVQGQRPGWELPLAYLMFGHVKHTHDRLGIPPEVAALAALGVRREHADRQRLISTGTPASAT